MRRVCYQVAASLDGFIADPNGGYDWIPEDPEIDMEAIFNRFDTFLVGRKTFELVVNTNQLGMFDGRRVYVFSSTLKPADHPSVTIVNDNWRETVDDLRSETPGKPEGCEIWLFGGGKLFQSILNARLVDRVEVAVMPILLGDGIPLLPSPTVRAKLKLEAHRVYKSSGIVMLEYGVDRSASTFAATPAAHPTPGG